MIYYQILDPAHYNVAEDLRENGVDAFMSAHIVCYEPVAFIPDECLNDTEDGISLLATLDDWKFVFNARPRSSQTGDIIEINGVLHFIDFEEKNMAVFDDFVHFCPHCNTIVNDNHFFEGDTVWHNDCYAEDYAQSQEVANIDDNVYH